MAKTVTSEVSFDFESVQVDEEAGIIRNVLVCGCESKNGYNFGPDAFGDDARVKSLYDGLPVCINHSKENPLGRSVQEVAGFLSSPRRNTANQVFADIQVEDSIDCGVDLIKLAKKRRRNIGLSHTAKYRMSRDGKTVDRVEKVITVDVVVNPATTQSFFEQEQDEETMDLAQIKAECDKLKADNAVLKNDLAKAESALTEFKTEANKLVGDVQKLTAEVATLKPALESYQLKEKAESDKLSIEKLVADAGLDVKCPTVFSEQFQAVLLMASPEQRPAIVADRKAALEVAGGTISPERKQGFSNESVTFSASDYLKKNLLK